MSLTLNLNKTIRIRLLFIVFSLFIYLLLFTYLKLSDYSNELLYNFYSYTYGIIAISGAILGVFSAKIWNFHKSYIGLTITALSLGLLSQGIGQFVYAYLVLIVQSEELYPSVAEIFFVTSIIFYIIGAFALSQVVGLKNSLQNAKDFLYAFSLGAGLLIFAYYKFISEHTIEAESNFTLLFLELFYPFGQSIFVFFSFFGLLLIRNILGGRITNQVFLIFLSLIAQFFADTLYSKIAEQYSDILYISSYSLMALAIVYFGDISSLKLTSQNGVKQK